MSGAALGAEVGPAVRANVERPPVPQLGDRPVALTGFMGVGKSSVGRIVAVELGRAFFDSDAEVVAELGETIPELFASGAESRFRAAESAVVQRLVARRPPAVIALGGGALEDPEARAALLGGSVLVHLELGWTELSRVLAEVREGRPLLADRTPVELEELFEARARNYSLAHLRVEARRDSAEATARRLVELLADL